MFGHHCRHPRRAFCRYQAVFLVVFSLLLLAPALDGLAQGIQIRQEPTATTEPESPGLTIEPTVTPTPRVTEETEIDDFQVEPTAVPAEPTEEPQPAAPSSLTINKGVCDDSGFDPYTATGLDAFLNACGSPDGEFEFRVFNDVAFDTTQSTELGALFMQVPTGPITITETIPTGWGDPAVFCWSNLFPSPAAQPFIGNGPSWDVAEGEDVECWWFNVSDAGGGHDFYLDKYECPEGFDLTGDWQAFSLGCTTPMDAGFNVTDGQGPMFQETAGGHAEWPNIDFGDGGDLVITETIPEGYGEPVVFCSILPAGAADPEDFDTQQMTVADGRVTVTPVLGEQDHYHCVYFNMPDGGAPGDLTTTDPQADGEGVTVTVIKHRCPLGVPEDTTYDQYIVICADNFPDLQFTLEHQGGTFPAETNENGEVEWTNVPAGEITILEALTAQYLDPLAFCGFFAGEQELQFGQQDAPGGLIELDIPDDATNVTCWLFNITDPDANNTVSVHKMICPPGTFTGSNDKNYYLSTCSDDHAGVTFTLTASHGEFTDATDADGGIEWTTVPLGDLSIQEEIPEGYGEPVVFCNFGDDFQNGPPVRMSAPGGLVSAAIEEPNIDYFCIYFNVPEAGNSLTVNKWICPPGFDKDVGNPDADCVWPMDGVTFTLGDLETTTGDFLAGRAVFQDVPDGEHVLTEDAPEGIDYAFIDGCTLNGAAQPLLLGESTFPSLELLIEADDHWDCEWYNVPVVESRVLVHKRICDSGVDLVLTEDNSIDNIIDVCPTFGDGIEFTLDHAGESSAQAIVDGSTLWDGVPNGPITVTETIPPGYLEPVWYCFSNPFDEAGDLTLGAHTWEPANAPGGVLSEALDEPYGETVECHVFNFHDDGSSVTVHKWLCPAGFDVEVDDPVADCTEPMDNVNFTLNDLVATTGDAGPGIAVFEDVPPGDDYELTEFLPGDTAYAFVTHCELSGGGALVPLSDEMPPVVLLDIGEGDHWTCNWYNVAAAGSRVVIEKHICPADVDLVLTDENSIDDFIDACPTEGNGIEFTLDHAGGSSTYEIHFGQTWWDGVPNGPITITETIPPGYLEPVWYCDSNVFDEHGDLVVDFQWEQYDAPAGVVAESLDEEFGEIFACKVFNVIDPDEENGILIYKWRCPEGTSLEESLDWYEGTCTEEHDGVDFKVASDLGLTVVETSGGQVQFDGLPAGTAGIQEYIPEGFGAPIVFCAPHGSPWQQVDAPTGYWEYDFPSDGVVEALVCYVFNIPGEPPDLTILKWTCPVGYDLFAAGADPSLDCAEATNGIAFELRFEGDATLQQTQTTGDVLAGGVFFDDLEPDVYNVAELVPDGIASAFVLECTGHIMGMLQPYPLQFGNVLDDIDLDAGEHLVCHWFNVLGEEGGDLVVIKYTCATEEFVSEVDCQVFEDGKTFDLLHWNTETGEWDVIDTQVTDGFGRIGWTGLAPGEYWLDEHDGEWCHISATPAEGGDSFGVNDGEESIVEVYNCDGEPGKPGDTPTKYPNTGVAPIVSELPVTGVGQATGGDSNDRSIFGPLAGVVSVLTLVGRFYFVIQRGRAERERREEEAWAEEAATRRERPGWMSADAGSPLTERPAWMAPTKGETPASYPDWMSR